MEDVGCAAYVKFGASLITDFEKMHESFTNPHDEDNEWQQFFLPLRLRVQVRHPLVLYTLHG